MYKYPKQSQHGFFPTSFRLWIKRRMIPRAMDVAVAKQKKLMALYTVCAVTLIHYCVYSYLENKHEEVIVDSNVPDDLAHLMAVNKTGTTKIIGYRFDGWTLKEKVDFDISEFNRNRQEEK